MPHPSCCQMRELRFESAVGPGVLITLFEQGRDTLMYTLPLAMSIWTLVDQSDGPGMRQQLMYWVVYAAFSASRDLWASVPLLCRSVHWVPRPTEVVFYTLLWMLMPFGGLPAIFRATVSEVTPPPVAWMWVTAYLFSLLNAAVRF